MMMGVQLTLAPQVYFEGDNAGLSIFAVVQPRAEACPAQYRQTQRKCKSKHMVDTLNPQPA